MATLHEQLTALTAYANGITGESDTKLGDAVKRLGDGYGQGGEKVIEGEFTLDSDTTKLTFEHNCGVIPKRIFFYCITPPSGYSTLGGDFRNATKEYGYELYMSDQFYNTSGKLTVAGYTSMSRSTSEDFTGYSNFYIDSSKYILSTINTSRPFIAGTYKYMIYL